MRHFDDRQTQSVNCEGEITILIRTKTLYNRLEYARDIEQSIYDLPTDEVNKQKKIRLFYTNRLSKE